LAYLEEKEEDDDDERVVSVTNVLSVWVCPTIAVPSNAHYNMNHTYTHTCAYTVVHRNVLL